MVLVSLNVNLEPYNGSQSQKSLNNIKGMLFLVYFHCKTIRNAANITAKFEKSPCGILGRSHFRLKKSEKSPAKSWRDCLKNYKGCPGLGPEGCFIKDAKECEE